MIGVDWGTSGFRAFRLAADGAVLERQELAMGILHVPDKDFAGTLRRAIGPWVAEGESRVLMCGMIGSRQGWTEAPYLPCPAGAAEIAKALIPVDFDIECRVVPGLSDADESDTPEVMRGEETQIVGVLGDIEQGIACLPGSHSKWARFGAGRISAFRTYLSGEAFSALKSGTILGRMMQDGPVDQAGFDRGVARSGEPGHVLHHLFGVRGLGLFGRLADGASASYLSGLLIGHEVRAARAAGQVVQVIGAASLAGLYARAIAACGGEAVVRDADAAAQGLAMIGRLASWG